VTCTTREPRIGEVDGVSYNFLSTDEFKKGIENDEFLEYANVFGDRFYGTRKKDVEKALATGQNVIMCLDVDGAMTVKKKRPETIMMFVTPPSLAELENRLINRGTETINAIRERLNRASYELQFKDKYDVILQNDDLYQWISKQDVLEIFEEVKKSFTGVLSATNIEQCVAFILGMILRLDSIETDVLEFVDDLLHRDFPDHIKRGLIPLVSAGAIGVVANLRCHAAAQF
jgi:guanylate kinase